MNNYKLHWDESKNNRNHHELLPRNFRAIICGQPNCGKTYLLTNMLLDPGFLDYDRLFLLANSTYQPKYQIIKESFNRGLTKEAIINIFKNENNIKNTYPDLNIDEMFEGIEPNKSMIKVKYFDDASEVPDPKDVDSSYKNLFIFDDIMENKKQNVPISYFSRGRHNNIDCIYISQDYHKLPRQTIRGCSNLIFLFRQKEKTINHIHEDIVSYDMDIQEFREFLKECWKDKYGYALIDLDSSPESGRKYRKMFEEFFIPKKYYNHTHKHKT